MKYEHSQMGNIEIGHEKPLAFICGPCVAEDKEMAMDYAARLKALSQKHQTPVIFKASFDKANRTSIDSYRGPGIEKGLPFLKLAAQTHEMPLLVDVHSPQQAEIAKDFADVLQVPAFLCRQTDLLLACAQTGKPVNVKKGQFLAPQDMAHVVAKLRSGGAQGISVTERGTSFGYHNLVVDMRGLAIMKEIGVPVVFDATHSVQLPGAGGAKSGGQREFVMPLARAAVAVGCDAIYAEVHHKPEIAKSDGPNALTFPMLDELMGTLLRIRQATQNC
jgi:2-dehydro-3-deoxyphosphooctonate aldolase (KDO 8-P synthase)